VSNKTIAACIAAPESVLFKKYMGKIEAEVASPLPDSEHLYEAERVYLSVAAKPWPVQERRILGEILALPAHQSLVVDTTPNTLKSALLQDILINLVARDAIEHKPAARMMVLSAESENIPLSSVEQADTDALAISIQAMQEGLRLVRAIFNIHEELDEEYRRHGGLKNRLQELTESLLVAEEKLKQAQMTVEKEAVIKPSFFKKLFSAHFKRNIKKQANLLGKSETALKGFVRAKLRAHEDWLRLSEAIEQFSLWLIRYGMGPVAFFDLLDWDALKAEGIPDLLSIIDTVFRQKQAQLFLGAHHAAFQNIQYFSDSSLLIQALSEEDGLMNWVVIDSVPLSAAAYAAILNKTERVVVLNDLTVPNHVASDDTPLKELDLLPEMPIATLRAVSTPLPRLPIRQGDAVLNDLACMILKLIPANKLTLDSNKVKCFIESDWVAQQESIKDILKSVGAKSRTLVLGDSESQVQALNTLLKRRKNVVVTSLQNIPNSGFDTVIFASDIDDETPRPYAFDKHREAIARMLMLAEKQLCLIGRFDLVGEYETTGLAQVLRYTSRVNRLEIEAVE